MMVKSMHTVTAKVNMLFTVARIQMKKTSISI